MSVKLIKKTLSNKYFKFNAICFIADSDEHNSSDKPLALFTHGYTASKADLISWAQRLCDLGISSCIFDLPGHELGSFNQVDSFESFTENAHLCFIDAYNFLLENTQTDSNKLILGGHSLGATLAIKALDNEEFRDLEKVAIGVGIGISQHASTHLFESSFYEKTLNIRAQLVHENLSPDKIFPWIRDSKVNIKVSNHRIHLITGKEDVVVGTGGMQVFAEKLTENNNQVTTAEPGKLPHHQPEGASSYIYSFVKKEFL